MFDFVSDATFFIFFAFVFILLNIFLLSSLITYIFLFILGVLFLCVIFVFEKQFYISCFIILALIIELLFILCLANVQNAKDVFKKKFFKKKHGIIFDRIELLKKIENAMRYLAQENSGALILIQNEDNLVEKYLNKENSRGVVIKSVVSEALLECIFYGHNRLHDGAVIIANNLIYAANVFVQSTHSEEKSKFGARHTAAYNASVQTDATVIMLSEEKKEMVIYEKGRIKKTQKFS
ncbi:MAG: DNA integrity scanning protein DisA nucleotide-binding domain protein [Bacilli bacterium]|nr:DNA integrity scanning protein DisA nucleotide-binding domain protein [Bacilli bacterium]